MSVISFFILKAPNFIYIVVFYLPLSPFFLYHKDTTLQKGCETHWTLTLYPVYPLRSKLENFEDHIHSSKPAAFKHFHSQVTLVGDKVPGISAISPHQPTVVNASPGP